MGYAGDLYKFISQLKYDPDTDDQRLLTSLHRHVRMTVDVESRLFYHQCGGMCSAEIPDTCVVTFPASGYTSRTLRRLGYELPPHRYDKALRTFFFWREFVVLVAACVGIYVLVYV